MRVLVLNGPNLDMLGVREPDVYGSVTLGGIEAQVRELGGELGAQIDFRQSNHEGDLVEALHAAREGADGVVFNPGAFTHYSYSLHDAVKAAGVPVIEVHLSNIAAREEFRARSVIAPACLGQVSGLGADSYLAGLEALVRYLTR